MSDNEFSELKKELIIKEYDTIAGDAHLHWGLAFQVKAWAVSLWTVALGYAILNDIDKDLFLLVICVSITCFWVGSQHFFRGNPR